MSADLTEFLLARIAEDEAATRELQRRAQDVQLTLQDPNALGRWIPGWHDWPDVEALTARVLAECDANRRIVAGQPYRTSEEAAADGGSARWQETYWLLRLLALPYADHPDWREEWRP